MIQVRKNRILVFSLLLLLIRWDINDYLGNSLTQMIENGACIFAALVIVCYLHKMRGRKPKMSIVFFILVFMQSWLLFSTFLNHGDIKRCFLSFFCPLAAVGLLCECFTESPDDFINGSLLLAELLCYANLLTIILFPNGLFSTYQSSGIWYSTANWLLGNRNDFIPYFVFFALIAFLYRSRGGKRWREWCIYIACFISVVLVNSATSIVGITVLLIAFLTIKTGKVKFNPYVLVAANVILFLVIVIFRLQNLFSILIEVVLGKSLTFTGRTLLWDRIIALLKGKYLLGFGVQKSGELQDIVGFSYAGHAHNLILNQLYRGGIVYLGLYLFAMLFVYRRLHKYRAHDEAQAISVALFVFQIIALMEPYEKTFFIYIIYFVAYHVNRFVSVKKQNISSLEKGYIAPVYLYDRGSDV